MVSLHVLIKKYAAVVKATSRCGHSRDSGNFQQIFDAKVFNKFFHPNFREKISIKFFHPNFREKFSIKFSGEIFNQIFGRNFQSNFSLVWTARRDHQSWRGLGSSKGARRETERGGVLRQTISSKLRWRQPWQVFPLELQHRLRRWYPAESFLSTRNMSLALCPATFCFT